MKPILLFHVLVAAVQAATYNVGPGHTYTTIGAVPWSSLLAGDTVNIYPRTAITATTATASTGTVVTLSSSAGTIPYGSSVWFAGISGMPTWSTCGTWGSGLNGTPTAGTPCTGNTVTLA